MLHLIWYWLFRKTASICERCWYSEKTAHFGSLYLARARNERFLANCHVKWSAQKGIGEARAGLCQTDGTPCCVFDWKRKVTFAAASQRQWSAKQIGLPRPPSPELARCRVRARLYFKIMLRARLSWARERALPGRRGQAGSLWKPPGLTCPGSSAARQRGGLCCLIATQRPQLTRGKAPQRSACCSLPAVSLREATARRPTGKQPRIKTHVQTTPPRHKGAVRGGGRWPGKRSLHLNSVPKHKHHQRQRACQCAVWAPVREGAGFGGGGVGVLFFFFPLFFFFFSSHLSWQPYSASVKTRYRNVLWVTFKTRYKSSALWDCSAINYLA